MNQKLSLYKDEYIELPDARGAILRITRGRVWLTQERDPRDIVLEAGASWAIDRNGLTVVKAQDDATVAITYCGPMNTRIASVARPRWPQRLSAWLARTSGPRGHSAVPYF